MSIKRFASGKYALGICDRCGRSCMLLSLKTEYYRRRPLGNKVCDSCWDPEHPQNFQGENVVVDGEALRDPRPDSDPGR